MPVVNQIINLNVKLNKFDLQQPLLRKILSKAADTFHQLFSSVADHFELCLAKCRTSSQVYINVRIFKFSMGKGIWYYTFTCLRLPEVT